MILSKEQKDLIATLLGELMYCHEHEYDWMEKDKLISKINACNILLDLPTTKEKSIEVKLKDIINDLVNGKI